MARSAGSPLPSVDSMARDLYGSLLDDTSLHAGLHGIGEAFRSHFTALHYEELAACRAGMEIFGEIHRQQFDDMSADYAARWAGQNLWVERGVPVLLREGWAVGDHVLSERELRQSEYFIHFLRVADIRHGLGILLQNDGAESMALVSLNRSDSIGDFTQDEQDAVAALRPHLVNAYAIHRRLQALRERAESLRASFDQIPLAMLLLGIDGQVVEHNAEAARLLAGGHGVRLGACGRLELTDPVPRAALAGALQRLGIPSRPPLPEAVMIPAGPHALEGALVLQVCALPSASTLAPRARLVAFLAPVNRRLQAKVALRLLQLTFDLTPTEATVTLALRDHHDPLHVGAELGLAISTVRTHLKHVFAKTGTDSQRALLRLVDCLLLAVRS